MAEKGSHKSNCCRSVWSGGTAQKKVVVKIVSWVPHHIKELVENAAIAVFSCCLGVYTCKVSKKHSTSFTLPLKVTAQTDK